MKKNIMSGITPAPENPLEYRMVKGMLHIVLIYPKPFNK
jgi:hypothetical protein